MIKSHSRGWEIYFDKEQWRYCDDNSLLSQNPRPCKKCGKFPTPEGYDACLGKVEGAISACCGHGCEKPYIIYEERNIKDERI